MAAIAILTSLTRARPQGRQSWLIAPLDKGAVTVFDSDDALPTAACLAQTREH